MARARLIPTAFLVAALIVALALRIANAGGELWVDEAWSVTHALRVAPFTGVFLDINHDNNHALNSLWIQLVGPEGSVLAYRSLSIAAGVASVVVAAAIARRRSTTAALTTALLFAVCPLLVILGSEARGYAALLLATLVAIDMTDRWIADPSRPLPRISLMLVAVAGTLCHLGFLLALPGLALWCFLALRKAQGDRQAINTVISLWLPAGAACFFMIAATVAISLTRTGVFTVGGYEPFSVALLSRAMNNLALLITGVGWIGMMALAALLIPRMPNGRLTMLCAFLAITLPLLVIIVRPGNSGIERYYALTGVALLLFAGVQIGLLIDSGGGRRFLGGGVLALLVAGALIEDGRQIAGQRGAPEKAIAVLARLSPQGADIAFQTAADVPVLSLASHRVRYRVEAASDCHSARFRFVGAIPGSVQDEWCGHRWRTISAGHARMPSGTSWKLFIRDDLPSRSTAVSSAPSKRSKVRFGTPERA